MPRGAGIPAERARCYETGLKASDIVLGVEPGIADRARECRGGACNFFLVLKIR